MIKNLVTRYEYLVVYREKVGFNRKTADEYY